MSDRQALIQGLVALGLDPNPAIVDRLLAYAGELASWNRVYNLTTVAPGGDTINRHLLDSLSVVHALLQGSILDVGSGAGLPGIPLALVHTAGRFTLLDSAGKKTRFLEHVRIRLKLDNVKVVQARAEAFSGQYDMVVCRGLAPLADIARMTAHLLAPGGRILAMKGEVTQAETEAVTSPFQVKRIDTLSVPGVDARRSLVTMAAAHGDRETTVA